MNNLRKFTRSSLSPFAKTFLSTIRETIDGLAKYELPDVLESWAVSGQDFNADIWCLCLILKDCLIIVPVFPILFDFLLPFLPTNSSVLSLCSNFFLLLQEILANTQPTSSMKLPSLLA